MIISFWRKNLLHGAGWSVTVSEKKMPL